MIARWWDAIERRAPVLAAAAALAAIVIGLGWGTYVAGGPDSYCYLNQAELFVQGRVRDPQPIVRTAPWPNPVETAVPAGHVAAPHGDVAAVPMCPAGYPLVLAVARMIGGRAAMFWIVPLFGGFAVWCTFLLGCRVAGAHTGVLAAVLLATSPTFLYQIVQPMSDVPAAAAWAAALVIALRPPSLRQAGLAARGASRPAFAGRCIPLGGVAPPANTLSILGRRALPIGRIARLGATADLHHGLLAGAVTGAALLIRPNLAPLGIVMAGVIFAGRDAADAPDAPHNPPTPGFGEARHSSKSGGGPRRATTAVIAFALGALPFLIILMILQNAMYGGPLTSGYGSLRFLFSTDHVVPNLARYPLWLVETQTPFVVLAFLAPWMASGANTRRRAWGLLSFVLVTFGCYLPYTVYDAWWFLRFLLPAFPPLLVLASMVVVAWISGLALNQQKASTDQGGQARLTPSGPDPWRFLTYVLVTCLLVAFQLVTAERRAVFRLRDLERRFRDAGEYVARRLPQNAVVLTLQQSGSVRFYAGRPTIVWDVLDPAWLDRALDDLRTRGYRPYFLFEQAEDLAFRGRFERDSRFGGLEWPPSAQIDRDVRIFDPLDYDRFRRGEKIETDYVFTSKSLTMKK